MLNRPKGNSESGKTAIFSQLQRIDSTNGVLKGTAESVRLALALYLKQAIPEDLRISLTIENEDFPTWRDELGDQLKKAIAHFKGRVEYKRLCSLSIGR